MPTNLYKVAIVGRVNVGKSTLFNKLISEKKAIVSPFSGTTRDRNYAICSWRKLDFSLIDTGGLENSKENINKAITEQIEKAITEADLILFLVDSKTGLMPFDNKIVKLLQKNKKLILLVTNKSDNEKLRNNIAEFYKLNIGDPIPISAKSGSGTGDLLDEIVKILNKLKKSNKRKKEIAPDKIIKTAIIGKPNVGKSSIINKILEKKVSITSRKSQTTRNNILGIKTDKNKQMIFIDTPGMHIKSKRTMNKILNKSAQSIIEDSDLVLFVLQRLTIDAEDRSIIARLRETNPLTICVINKIDQIKDKNQLLPFINELTVEYEFDSIIPISAETGQNLEELVELIKDNLPENNHIYGEELSIGDDKNRFMISELIREKIIRKLGDELPHDTYVDIEDIKEKNNVMHINATIFVNRKSQKQIVIGSGGKNLKIIGEQARVDIEELLQAKVFLKTWVKVKKNWNTDTGFIHSLGVGTNHESS